MRWERLKKKENGGTTRFDGESKRRQRTPAAFHHLKQIVTGDENECISRIHTKKITG